MNKIQHTIQTKGMTMIELLVYIGVSTIFLLAISAFAFTLLGTHRQTQSYFDLYRESHIMFDQMTRNIAEGYDIGAGSTFAIDLARQSGYLEILYPAPALAKQFSVSGSTLQVREGTSPAVPMHGVQIATEHFFVSDFSSTDNRSTHVYITGTFSRAVGFGLPRAEVTLHATVELKNYEQ